MDASVDLVRRALDDGVRETFERRVREGAQFLREELREGNLDNEDPAIGLELECYAVDESDRLARLPGAFFEGTPVNPELGRHDVEVNTPPNVFSEEGIDAQVTAIADRLSTARDRTEALDRRIVLDAMWTLPPGEGTREYLGATDERDGLVFAENMYESPRYYALDNAVLRTAGDEIELDVPGIHTTMPTILVESLATSMQPHLQVPSVDTVPQYYNAGLRTLAPVLALATNSPFLPADLYDDPDPERLLAETYHELRIPVFEQAINAGLDPGKVRFPRDVENPAAIVDRIVADRTYAPFLREWIDDGKTEEDYSDAFWEFDHKHGTYWRWLRGVIGGEFIDDANDERSLRIEYRPLPTQPSVRDVVGFQLLVAGLLRGLVDADHPLPSLDWERARDGFYAVVEDGLDAEFHWVTEAGEHTTDPERIYGEVFDYARRGIRAADVSEETVDRYFGPIERRWEQRTTPSRWKIDRVRERIEAGASLTEAITGMQRAYLERAGDGEPFVEWA